MRTGVFYLACKVAVDVRLVEFVICIKVDNVTSKNNREKFTARYGLNNRVTVLMVSWWKCVSGKVRYHVDRKDGRKRPVETY